MEIIWHILLTACIGSNCVTQDVQWFDTKQECELSKGLHQQIPIDGDWTSVTYLCKPINSEGV